VTAGDHLGQQFIHTTDAKLRPGDIVKSAAELGIKDRWPDNPGTYNPKHVYISHPDVDPAHIEQFGKHDYAVQPLGPVKRDQEYALYNRAFVSGDNPAQHSYRTTSARVIGKHKWTEE
jgi:hypothetical protein